MDEETLRTFLFEEIGIVKDIASRMGNNSFLIKGWAVTLIVASLVIGGTFYQHLVAFFPWFVFWAYDAYFLRMERLYRKLYDWLIKNRLKTEEFLMEIERTSLDKRFGKEIPSMWRVMFSRTLVVFYGFLFVVIIVSVYLNFARAIC